MRSVSAARRGFSAVISKARSRILSRLAGDSDRRDRAWILNGSRARVSATGRYPCCRYRIPFGGRSSAGRENLRNLADCEREIGDKKTALALLDEVVALAPRYGRAWYERASFCAISDGSSQQSKVFGRQRKQDSERSRGSESLPEPSTAHSREMAGAEDLFRRQW